MKKALIILILAAIAYGTVLTPSAQASGKKHHKHHHKHHHHKKAS